MNRHEASTNVGGTHRGRPPNTPDKTGSCRQGEKSCPDYAYGRKQGAHVFSCSVNVPRGNRQPICFQNWV
jgi:hypothetical protein